MGYLDGSTVTVDAILTKHGRLKLSRGDGLNITQFSLADDGVDYSLWNADHPSGSANYGQAIEDLPMLETVPDDSVMLKYKLVTLDRNTIFMPYIRVVSPLTVFTQQDKIKISPVTENGNDSNYTFDFTDVSAVNIVGGTSADVGGTTRPFLAQQEIPQAASYTSSELTITAKPTNIERTLKCFITGMNTGAIETVDITVKANIRINPLT